ncbi:MAG: Trk system potassium transporter TrkA [Firmicutes bacterium]|nr:Trk system potassium transporter TrkA [Bacillota bacterium]
MKIVIIGAGKLGFDLARVLSQENHDIIVIDKNAEAIGPIADNFDVMTVVGNGASIKVLEEVQVKTADILLAVTNNDELNIIACMFAKQLGVRTTAARVRNPDYSTVLPSVLSYTNFGINLIINPEYLAAQEIFRLIEVPTATGIDYFAGGKLSMISIKVAEDMEIVGKKIAELNLEKYTIVAVIRKEEVIIPNGKTQLLQNDKIYVLGKTAGFHNLNGLIKLKKPKFKQIVIAGGGLITHYLVSLLQTKKNLPEIKIIEPSADRCRTLSTELGDCQIICADATKMEILDEENLGGTDIFIASTGSDNSNLVACMLAKKKEVGEIICEVSREDYINLAEGIGVTAAITPRLLTVSTVLKLMRRKNVISVNLLNTGEAAMLELEAEPESPITRSYLRNLKLPPGVVIGSITQQGNILVPRGDTLIQPGDRAIIFALRAVAPKIEQLFHYDGVMA